MSLRYAAGSGKKNRSKDESKLPLNHLIKQLLAHLFAAKIIRGFDI
jgi:hypothetical protein